MAIQEITSANSEEAVRQYLTFLLGGEQYGIEILSVQEIKGYTGVTSLPNTPRHIRGIMNLRGTVIPVVDLRIRFGMPEQEYTKFNVVIVLKLRTKAVGLVVDAVSDVLDIAASDLKEAPEYGARTDSRFIQGIATMGEKLVVILDIDKLLTDDEISVAA